MIDSQAATRFRQLGALTIFAVYFLILVGGIVRASGAGMGCPDWPTCFGQWVPPLSESQLPENYHAIYAARGYENTDFNPLKTWTEYTNRLVGVSIGFMILLTTWASRIYLKSDKTVFYLALTVVVLICFQAWLGSAVVASNLKPIIITLHMLMALLIVCLLIYAITRSQKAVLLEQDCSYLHPRFRLILKIAMGMSLLQIAMGTQIREAIDIIAQEHNYIDRQYWRGSFPIIFYVHRSFSSLILFTNLWLAYSIFKPAIKTQNLNIMNQFFRIFQKNHFYLRLTFILVCLILIAILAGVSLDRLGFPAVAQPIHLLMANLIFGTQFYLFICLKYSLTK